MENIMKIIQLISGILLIITILMQNRGSGIGGAFGGGSEVYSVKRGVEKTIFNISIVLAIIFLASGLLRVLVA